MSVTENTRAHLYTIGETGLIEGPDKAVLLIGSNNLTSKGLFENYELSVACELDPKDKEDAAVIKAAKEIFNRFADTASGMCKVLTKEFLEELDDAGYLGSEAKGTKAPEGDGAGDGAASPPKKKLFGSKAVMGAPKFTKKAVAGNVPGSAPPTPPATPAAPIPAASAPAPAPTAAPTSAGKPGLLVWEKNLSASDAQRSTGTTNAVGGLRLTQAKYKVSGQVINQTTYFRKNVFGSQTWKTKKQKPFEENTFIDAEVIIKGKSQGVMKLEVSHKPSGEAGQGNYTTQIHWGSLNPVIKASQLAGRRLRLYAPAKGSSRYTIEIA